MSTHWYTTRNPNHFWKDCQSFLLLNESRYAQTIAMIQDELDAKASEWYLGILQKDNSCCGFFVLSSHGDLSISELRVEEIVELVSVLKQANHKVHRITGPRYIVEKIQHFFTDAFRAEMHQIVFECANVILPDKDGGQLIQAKDKHKETVRSMLLGFLLDCFPSVTHPNRIVEHCLMDIKKGNIYLWANKKGMYVSMAAMVRKTPRTTSISWVYTPVSCRGKGYASKVTAYLSQEAISQGRPFCNLLTDGANPTSNSIYTKIGYRKIGEQSVYKRPSL